MKYATVGAISCLHAPFTDWAALEWALGLMKKERFTHFVVLGDVFEAAAASVHENEYEHSLKEEYRCGARALKRIRETVGKRCALHWMLGNHDDNLTARDKRRIPKGLRDAIHWNRDEECGAEYRQWQQHPYVKSFHGTLRIGQLIVAHGWDTGATSDELEAFQLNNLHGGEANRLVVRGHTHRPVPITRAKRTAKIPVNLWFANVGHMGPTNPDWARRMDTSQWGNGLLVAKVGISRSGHYVGRAWDAEVRMRSAS